MRNVWKVIIVLILASLAIAVVMLKNTGSGELSRAENKNQPMPVEVKPVETKPAEVKPAKAIEEKVPQVNEPIVRPVKPAGKPLEMTVKVVDPAPAASLAEPKKLPILVDLGADRCIPCKMMIPVLKELSEEYKGKLQVEFHDVWKNPAPTQQYGIRVIPTQIFLDPQGKELYRHEGYFSKEDILAQWKELGFDLSK